MYFINKRLILDLAKSIDRNKTLVVSVFNLTILTLPKRELRKSANKAY